MDDEKLYDLSKHLMTLTATMLALLVLYFKSDYSPKGHDYILSVIGIALLLAFSSATYSAYKVVVNSLSESTLKYLQFSLIVTVSSIFVTLIKLASIV